MYLCSANRPLTPPGRLRCGFLLREWVMMVGPLPPPPAPAAPVAAPVVLPLPPAAGQPPPFLQAPHAHEADDEQPALEAIDSDEQASSGESDSGEDSDEESSDENDDARSWEERYAEPAPAPAPAPRAIASNSRARQTSVSSWSSSNDRAGPSSRRSLEIGSSSRRGGRRARRQRRREQDAMEVDDESEDDDDAWEDQPQRSSSPDVPHDITPDDGGNVRIELDFDPVPDYIRAAYDDSDPESVPDYLRAAYEDDSDPEDENNDRPTHFDPNRHVEEVAAVLDELIVRAAAPPPLAGPAAAPPAEGVEGFPGEDGFDGDVLDDFDGVLEAIGMKGSLLVLVQNMGLMCASALHCTDEDD